MKVCIPSATNSGLQGMPYGHFGSAPFFVVHDIDAQTTDVLDNGDQHHAHGGCNPVASLGGRKIDALIVGGIGARALQRLAEAGIRVYQAVDGSIADNVTALRTGSLVEMELDAGCQEHGGCAH